MRKLDFLVIGSMKSGTTTLHDYLALNPEICMSTPKEPGFFSRDERFKRGIKWYEKFFIHCNGERIYGESSTCYSRCTYYKNTAKRIYEYAPDIKLIYIIRHPVDRAYSHYRHSFFNREIDDESFSEALRNHRVIIETSMYMSQIREYLKWFERERLLLIDFYSFINNPHMELQRIYTFLGVEGGCKCNQELKSNRAGDTLVKGKIRKSLWNIRKKPFISYVVDNLVPSKYRRLIMKKLTEVLALSLIGNNIRKRSVNKAGGIRKEDKEYILKECKNDTKELEQFSGLDLRAWYH